VTQRDENLELTLDSDSSDDFDGFKFRVVLLGEATVGKTSLLRRYTENVFDEEYKQTLGTTFATKDIDVKDSEGSVRSTRLSIWDMGGQSTYRELRRQYMKGSSAAIANKIDLADKRMVPQEPGMMLRDWFQSEYYETSAKDGTKVTDVFQRCAEVVLLKAVTEGKSPLA